MITKTNNYKKIVEDLIKETDNISFQIRLLRHENQKLTVENDEKIAKLQETLIETENQIKETLTESNEDSIKVNCGWTHWRIMPDQWIFNDNTVEEIETFYPETADYYIKISKSLKKDPLKKDLESGSITLKNYTVEPQEKKFEYKYTGEE